MDHYASEAMANTLEQWKVHQIQECSKKVEKSIRCTIAKSCKGCLMSAAAELGLTLEKDTLRTPHRNPPRAARRTPATTPPLRERRSQQPSQSLSETGAITVPLRSVQNTQPEPDSTDIAAMIRVVIGPVMSRLKALERLSMPPPPPP